MTSDIRLPSLWLLESCLKMMTSGNESPMTQCLGAQNNFEKLSQRNHHSSTASHRILPALQLSSTEIRSLELVIATM